MMKGLYQKFKVTDTNSGKEVEEKSFTLIPSKDPHAIKALETYANSVKQENPVLAKEILDWINGC